MYTRNKTTIKTYDCIWPCRIDMCLFQSYSNE